MKKPKYRHDCTRCVWFGTHEHNFDGGKRHVSDFYLCLGAMHEGYAVTKQYEIPLVLARHSHDDPDYACYHLSHVMEDYLNKIRHTALGWSNAT